MTYFFHDILPLMLSYPFLQSLVFFQDMVPLLFTSLKHVEDTSQKQSLLQLLLFLSKKPDFSLRRSIATALLLLGNCSSLLEPHCSALLGSKHCEQRALAASLIIVMVLTCEDLETCLWEDLVNATKSERDEEVADLLCSSLALVVVMNNSCSRQALLSYSQVVLGLLEINDTSFQSSGSCNSSKFSINVPKLSSSLNVNKTGINLIFAALTQKYFDEGLIIELVEYFRETLDDIISSGDKHSREDKVKKVGGLLAVIDKMLPLIVCQLLVTMPDHTQIPDIEEVDEEVNWLIVDMKKVLTSGDIENKYYYLRNLLSQEWFKSWPTFDYLVKSLFPSLVHNLNNFLASDSSVVQASIHLFYNLVLCLGDNATEVHISPLFHKLFSLSDEELSEVRNGTTSLTRAPFVVFTVAILGQQHQYKLTHGTPAHSSAQDVITQVSPLQDFLTRHISIVCLSGGSMVAVQHSIHSLVSFLPCTREAVLSVLWACLVSKSDVIRAATGPMWLLFASAVPDEALLTSRVVPGLVTMAADEKASVRAAAILPLSRIGSCSNFGVDFTQETSLKCSIQLEALLEDNQLQQYSAVQFSLTDAITESSANMSANATVLNGVLLPRLSWLVTNAGASLSTSMIKKCCAAYTALLHVSLQQHIVAHFVLPPLQELLLHAGPLSSEVSNLLREFSQMLGDDCSSSPAGISTSVDDMKLKMNKMLSSGRRQMSERASFPSLFKKK